ncbi:GLIPR1-like protein 1 [Clonorchis sinensis]|uniref:GLIPR1-like protein 1 n=1 Tax=Clonorchis sinensis TaxID=79923 RepID=G7YJS8_CLOSI|nr:GLIPR1-like protein 1 [Clonorchis sinensis]
MNPFRHDSFLAPGFSHHYGPKTSAVLAELRESFTEMDEEDWDLHWKRQFTRQKREDKRKFLVSLRPWMDDKLAVPTTSEEDDNRPDYRCTGCAPVTHDEEVASQEDNHRSVCGSLGCAPITVDSKHSSEDNGAHSHCMFFGAVPLTMGAGFYGEPVYPSSEVMHASVAYTTCEQAVPLTMGAGFYGEPVYPSSEVMHASVAYFQTVSTQCLRFVKFLAWKRRFETWLNGFSVCVCVRRRDLVRTVSDGLYHANFELCPAIPTYKVLRRLHRNRYKTNQPRTDEENPTVHEAEALRELLRYSRYRDTCIVLETSQTGDSAGFQVPVNSQPCAVQLPNSIGAPTNQNTEHSSFALSIHAPKNYSSDLVKGKFWGELTTTKGLDIVAVAGEFDSPVGRRGDNQDPNCVCKLPSFEVSELSFAEAKRPCVQGNCKSGCEIRTLRSGDFRRRQVFDRRCLRKIARISWSKRVHHDMQRGMKAVTVKLSTVESSRLPGWGSCDTAGKRLKILQNTLPILMADCLAKFRLSLCVGLTSGEVRKGHWVYSADESLSGRVAQCVYFIAVRSAPSIALSGDWQSEMVRLHNEARDKILTCSVSGQPPAKSMPHLSWHAGLAEKAQQLADQCRVGHDKAEERKVPDFDYVGQNWAGVQDIETAVRMWFEEHVNYDFSTGNCRQGMCGHYTQVVWASTTHIGCGVRDCRDTGSFPYGLSIVCNYGPAGNFVGAKPYEEGSSADCKPVGETNSPKPPDEGDQGVELPTESGQEAEQPGENDQGATTITPRFATTPGFMATPGYTTTPRFMAIPSLVGALSVSKTLLHQSERVHYENECHELYNLCYTHIECLSGSHQAAYRSISIIHSDFWTSIDLL